MLKYFAFTLLGVVLFIHQTTAQELCAGSKNSRVFAYAFPDGKIDSIISKLKKNKLKDKAQSYFVNTIKIFQVKESAWIQEFKFFDTKNEKLDEIGFSPSGAIFWARAKENFCIWNTMSGELLMDTTNINNIGFSNHSGFFLVQLNNYIIAYDQYDGSFINRYKISAGTIIKKIETSPDDKYITAFTSEDKIIIWDTKEAKVKTRFTGSELMYSTADSVITLYRNKENKVYITFYAWQTLERLDGFNTGQIIRTLDNADKADVKIGNKKEFEPIDINNSVSKLSPDGKFLAYTCKKSRKEKLLLIIDNTSKNVVSIINTKNYKDSINIDNFHWHSPDVIMVSSQHMFYGIYNIEDQEFNNTLNLGFDFKNDGVKLHPTKQIEYRKVSPNMNYIALELIEKNQFGIYVKSSLLQNSTKKLVNYRLLDFSANSKLLFAKDDNSRIGSFLVSDLVDYNGDNYAALFKSFSSELIMPTPEDEIEQDADLPLKYNYLSIKNFKFIGEAQDTVLIKLRLKTVEFGNKTAGLQVHLLDENGTYYYGASDKKWRYIWRNLLVKDPFDNLSKITNFTIDEFIGKDSLPNAIALVLDHSGSMGSSRAKKLQEAAEKFIQNKQPEDAIVLIKYDSKIGVECVLSKDKQRLLKSLKKNGLSEYGGATALLDAIDRGVNILSKADGYGRKTVIIFTDGNENSSVLSKGGVLKHANYQNINIFTIGFGDYVSEDYLQSLAFYTQGSYYHIYKTYQFNEIFQDIYYKMKYYYTIRFKTDTIGTYSTFLEIGMDDSRIDSLVTAFSNIPIDYDKLDKEDIDKATITNPLKTKTETIDVKKFTSFTDSLKTREKVKQDSIKTAIRMDFEKIHFPDVKFVFNQTEIVPGTEKGIEQVVAFMKKHTKVIIGIHGHTDDVGSENENLKLSNDRASRVKDLIVKSGIEENRIESKGYGKSQPVEQAKTEEARAKNRRVEFLILRYD